MKKELSTGFNTRQYMNSGEFEVFFYNDIDLDHVVDHTHPYYEIYFFLNGDVTYEVDGNRYELQYGDYLMIPPETRHHPIFHSTGQDYRRFVLWISRPYYEALVARSEDFAYSFRQVEKKKAVPFPDGFYHLSGSPGTTSGHD